MLKEHLPRTSLNVGTGQDATLLEVVTTLLGGPPERVALIGSWFRIGGCRRHSCDEKALVLVHKETSDVAGAIAHYFWEGARTKKAQVLVFGCESPASTRELLRAWIEEHVSEGVATTRCVAADGEIRELDCSKPSSQCISE